MGGGEWEEGEDRLGGQGGIRGGRVGGGVARPRPFPLVAFHRGMEPALAPIPGRGLERRGTPPDAPPAGGWGLGRRVTPDAPPADRRGLERGEAPNAPPAIPRDYDHDYDYDPYLGYYQRYGTWSGSGGWRRQIGGGRPVSSGRRGSGRAVPSRRGWPWRARRQRSSMPSPGRGHGCGPGSSSCATPASFWTWPWTRSGNGVPWSPCSPTTGSRPASPSTLTAEDRRPPARRRMRGGACAAWGPATPSLLPMRGTLGDTEGRRRGEPGGPKLRARGGTRGVGRIGEGRIGWGGREGGR